MSEQQCRKCGEWCEAEDLDEPADIFYCECGHSWCNTDSWADRQADHADYLRKKAQEEPEDLSGSNPEHER